MSLHSNISVILSISFLYLFTFTYGKNIYHEFRINYITSAPDGISKLHLAVNGKFPGPTIEANVGDSLQIVIFNDIQDGQNLSMHWHGIHHRGTPFQDGANLITQCPLQMGQNQTYVFNVDQPGTYWYHSHVRSQYTEGLWGALIVHNPNEGYHYDGEFLVALSDWYHRSAHENEYWYLSTLSHGAPPYPDTVLVNGIGLYSAHWAKMRSHHRECDLSLQKRNVFRVKPQGVYRVRVINSAANSMFRFSIDGHKLKPIEVDGVEVLDASEVDEVMLSQGQRYSFLVDMNGNLEEYLVRVNRVSEVLFWIQENITPFKEALIPNVTALLRYLGPNDDILPITTTESFDYRQPVPAQSPIHNPILLDEMLLRPTNFQSAPQYVDKQFILQANFTYDTQGIRRGSFNGSFFSLPMDFPLLMTVIEGKPIPAHVTPHVINYADVVEIIINNPYVGPHPFHLHGHHFWVVGLGAYGDKDYDPSRHRLTLNGVYRDTILVQHDSWAAIRFVADNPGVWNFHCHNDWHNLSGMAATFVEAPEILRNMVYPDETRRVCEHHGIKLKAHN